MSKRKFVLKILALFVFLSAIVMFQTNIADAAYTSGTAPFINTWLLSGPFDSSVSADPAVSPKEGDAIGGSQWEYFDDRIFDRNLDDYQDLYSYFKVKNGRTCTDGKIAYAHIYVYSSDSKSAQFRIGASGTFEVWVNGASVGSISSAEEGAKDKSSFSINLNSGWNRILVKLTMTRVCYWGFYGRICDSSGNEISGLEYSTEGAGNSALEVSTKGLACTENNMPYGFTEWQYVWTKSTRDTEHWRPQASKFRFYAQGGTPGYTWTIASGSLPPGLSLASDGTIDGYCGTETGTYSFTVKVTDSADNQATKALTIQVKERPNKWLEEARQVALCSCGPTYTYNIDANYSADLWAERMKNQGIEAVYFESGQLNPIWWPSVYAPSGTPDSITAYMQAIKRYGIRWGLYYPSEGCGTGRHHSSNGFVLDVEDLQLRYNPDQWFFDGGCWEQGNVDVMYSIVRAYREDAVIITNGYPEQGDSDMRITECPRYWSYVLPDVQPWATADTKKDTIEAWRHPFTKTINYWSIYHYGQVRDDWRNFAKCNLIEMCTGQIADFDQQIAVSRGPGNNDAPFENWPVDSQVFIDMREAYANWINSKLESVIGTNPGPLTESSWGYSTQRDNLIYMHIMENPVGKTGMPSGGSITVSPVDYEVTKVTLLNDGSTLGFVKSGNSVTINTAGIETDPIDTIIKIETQKPYTGYPLTSIKATGSKTSSSTVQVKVEGYLNNYVGLKANLTQIGYSSSNTAIADVDNSGLVTAIGEGTASITASATYNGVTKTDSIDVKVDASNSIRVMDTMIGAVMRLGGKELYYGKLYHLDTEQATIEGRGSKGGSMDISPADITYYTDSPNLIGIDENGTVSVKSQISVVKRVTIWADVALDGITVTTNKVNFDVGNEKIVSINKTATASNSSGSYTAEKACDGTAFPPDGSDSSKWSSGSAASGAWWQVDLQEKINIYAVDIGFDNKDDSYINVPKSITFQVSDDGDNWTTVISKTSDLPSNGSYSCIEPYNYSLYSEGRYLRLLFEDGAQETSIDLSEVSVWTKDSYDAANYAIWGFNSDGTDSSGNYFDATLHGDAAYSTADKKEGTASLSLDGSGDYADASLVTKNTDNITLSAWVKWNGATTDHQQIICNGNTTNSGYGIFLNYGDSNRVSVLCSGVAVISSDITLDIGEWTNITAVRRSGTWELYIDGSSVSITDAEKAPKTPTGGTYIGGNGEGSQCFNGLIDAVRIYSRALPTGEIQEIASGLELSSIAITTPAAKLVYTVGDSLDISGMVVTGTYSDGSTRTENITAANVSGFDSSVPAASQTLTVTVEGKTATYTVEIRPSIPIDFCAMWGFNSDGTDSSGNGLDATLNGDAAYSTADKKEGTASLSLDGSGDYADASLATTNTDNITLSAWVKWNGSTEDHQQILCNGNTSSGGYAIFLNYGDSNRISVLCSGVAILSSETTLTAGEWTNITAVRRSGTWELYIDGSGVSITDTEKAPKTPTGGTYIGGNGEGSQCFNGLIDAVRIYSRALSTNEITAIANETSENSDMTAPSLTAGTVSRTSDTEATVKFTSDEDGQYYYTVVADGTTEYTIDTEAEGTDCTAGEITITDPVGLSAGAKDIYIKVKDAAGNVSDALKIDIPALCVQYNVNTDFMSEAGIGVFVHYLEHLQNENSARNLNQGQSTSWNECVNSFDVEKFADEMAEVGADYVVFTVMQVSKYMIAPNETYNSYTGYSTGEACSTRDLISDLYDALNAKGIKLMLYTTGDGPKNDTQAANGLGWTGRTNSTFQDRWFACMKEYSDRYGSKIAGWWVDGCYSNLGYDNASLTKYAANLKSGNPDAVVAFNPGVIAIGRYVSADDYTCGERTDLSNQCSGRWIDGCQWHCLTYLGSDWAYTNCRYTSENISDYVNQIKSNRGAITLDVGLYRNGTISETQKNQLIYISNHIFEAGYINEDVTGTGKGHLNYSGTWNSESNSDCSGGTLCSSSQADDYVTIKFRGTQIEWYSDPGTNAGIAAVSIDGGEETNIDLYSAETPRPWNTVVYTSPVLSSGTHSLKIRVTGNKNGNSSDCLVFIDGVKVSGSTDDPDACCAIWGFNGSGTDGSDNGFDATLCGNASYNTEDKKEGTASLSLDGSEGNYAYSSLATTNTDNITLSAWVKWNGAATDHQQIICNGNTTNSGYGIFLNYGDSNRISVLCSGVAILSSETTLTAGEWTNITAVRRSGTWELYIDGNGVSITDTEKAPKTPTGGTYIGGNGEGSQCFNGLIDAVRIYGRALSTNEITAIANETSENSDMTAPSLTAGTVSRTSDTEATVKFTSDEDGQYYYTVVEDGTTNYIIDTNGTGTECGTDETTISLTGLSTGAKDIYIKVKDAAGNVSSALKMDIPAYTSENKPFTVTSAGKLDRTTGIKASADIELTPETDTHAGKEVVIFQLMKGSTPVGIVAVEKDIVSKETFTAYFNVADPDNSTYLVKVFVFDAFNSDMTASINLAEPAVMN